MARIHEEIIVIKLSKLVRESTQADSLVTSDVTDALEAVVQELVGDSVIVEIDQAK
jgi:hypothetical protein